LNINIDVFDFVILFAKEIGFMAVFISFLGSLIATVAFFTFSRKTSMGNLGSKFTFFVYFILFFLVNMGLFWAYREHFKASIVLVGIFTFLISGCGILANIFDKRKRVPEVQK